MLGLFAEPERAGSRTSRTAAWQECERVREAYQSAVKHCRCQLYERNSDEDRPCGPTANVRQVASMSPERGLIPKQPARDERSFPNRARRSAALGQEASEDYGRVSVNQQSLRSPASSGRISLSGATGAGGDGTSPGGSAGGEIHPCRTASASVASAKIRLLRRPRRPDLGNDSGAVGDQNCLPRSRQPHILAQATS